MEQTDHESGTRCLVVGARRDAFGSDRGLMVGFLEGGEDEAGIRGRRDVVGLHAPISDGVSSSLSF